MKPNLNPGARSLLKEQFDTVFPKPSSIDEGESNVTKRGGRGVEVYDNRS
jgi:hypothetical protein